MSKAKVESASKALIAADALEPALAGAFQVDRSDKY
jgi:hypothetical protein